MTPKSHVDKNLREKVMKQREAIVRKGIVIDNKRFRKGVIRPLPSHGEPPGREYRTVYCEEVGGSVTCPSTFGFVDPLWDYIERTKKTGDKDAKDHLYDYLNASTEFWMPCVWRGDEGTADNPNVMIFRAKPSVYEQITEWIVDEEIGEDITSAKRGRDIYVKKTGEGKQTRWKAERMDAGPISEDKKLMSALVEIAESFDVTGHMFKFELERYEAIYQGLTGEALSDEDREALAGLEDQGGRVHAEGVSEEYEDDEYDDEEEEGEDEEYEEEADGEDEEYEEEEEPDDEGEGDDEEEPEEEGPEPPDGIEFGKTRVTFQYDDGEVEGTVLGWDEEGEALRVVEDDGDPEDPYYVEDGDYEIVEADEEEPDEEEEEPEEAAPAVRGGRKKKKTPRKPAASAKKTSKRQAKPASRKKKTTARAKASTTKKAGTGSRIRGRGKK